jgi:biopolymer transport protein ExbD
MLSLETEDDARRRKNATTFPLTPLADAMFQLLVFFMLSAGLSPYSMLLLQSGTSTIPTQDPGRVAIEAAPGQIESTTWTLEAGRINANDQPFNFVDLPDLIAGLTSSGVRQIVLIILPDASVQDLAIVLEALTTAQINGIQLVRNAP